MTRLGNSSCGACKFLRRKCTSECVFAPYFSYHQSAAHFGVQVLLHLPLHSQGHEAVTISDEALARMRDLVYDCVAHIYALQQQVVDLQEEKEIQMGANYALDITSSSQASDSIPPETELASKHHAMDMPFYPTQHLPNGNASCDQMNLELPES